MSGGLGALSMAWVAAGGFDAARLAPDGRCASARQRRLAGAAAGPLDGQTVHGRGAQPDQALRRLADELRRMRGPMTGDQ